MSAPAPAEITVHRCVVRVIRHGGWSWGPDPRGLVRQVLDALPDLITERFIEQLSGDGPDVEITEPVRLTARLGLSRSPGYGAPALVLESAAVDESTAVGPTLGTDVMAGSAFSDQRSTDAHVESFLVENSWTPQTCAVLFSELAERGDLDPLLALLPDSTLWMYLVALLDVGATKPLPVVGRFFVEFARRLGPMASLPSAPGDLLRLVESSSPSGLVAEPPAASSKADTSSAAAPGVDVAAGSAPVPDQRSTGSLTSFLVENSWTPQTCAVLFSRLAERGDLDPFLALLPDETLWAYLVALLRVSATEPSLVVSRFAAELAGRPGSMTSPLARDDLLRLVESSSPSRSVAEPPSASSIADTSSAAMSGAPVPSGAEPGTAESGGAEAGTAVPGGAESGVAEPGTAESGGAVPGGAVPGGAVPGGAEPDNAEPGAAVSGVAMPGAAVPGAAVPGVAVSRGAMSGAVGETRVWSALPFLLAGPLARIGYLDAIGPALAGVDLLEDAPLFAATLAYKVLGVPERGWRRTEEDNAVAAAFAGLESAPDLGGFARRMRPVLPVLDAVLALSLRRGHDPAHPLLIIGVDGGLLLVDAQGMFPVAWAPEVAGLLPHWQACGTPAVAVCDSPLPPQCLRELAAAGVRFVTDVRPLRGDPVPRLPWRTPGPRRTPLWASGEPDPRLAVDLPDYAERLGELVQALFVARRAFPLAEDGTLERSTALAASLGLGAIAWTLWRDRETPDPVLALTRFADLDATVQFSHDAVHVRVPLGRRHADLLRSGALADVPNVVWLGGRTLTFSGG